MKYIIIVFVVFFSTYGLLSIYKNYFLDQKTTFSFSMSIRDDGTGYMEYDAVDLLACQALLSPEKTITQ